MTYRRKLQVGRNGGFEDVSAKNKFELYQEGPSSGGPSGGFGLWLYRLLSFSGMYVAPSFSTAIYAGFREFFGSMLIGTVVGVVAFFSLGLNVLLGGLLVGVAYAGAFYLASLLPCDDSLRGNYNGAITLGYIVTSRIGLLGGIFYLAAQLAGSLVAGGILVSALAPYDPAVGPVVQATVPLPTTLITSLTTVICLEIFGAMIIVLVLLLSEFVGTNAAKPEKNHHKGMRNAAIATVVLVTIGFPFQVFTYSNVAYFGPLFGNVGNTHAATHMSDLAQLCNSTLYTNSVFNGHCGAWAHYYFSPLAGGLAAGIIAVIIFLIRFPTADGMSASRSDINDEKRYPQSGATLGSAAAAAAAAVPAAIQSQAVPLASPFHRTH